MIGTPDAVAGHSRLQERGEPAAALRRARARSMSSSTRSSRSSSSSTAVRIDRSSVLQERLPSWSVRTQLVELSRNFGSFAAIAAGLRACRRRLLRRASRPICRSRPSSSSSSTGCSSTGEADIVFGHRTGRADPGRRSCSRSRSGGSIAASSCRTCRRAASTSSAARAQVRDRLLELRELNTNLIALLFWLGFRRAFVPYERRPRLEGRSAWTFGRKFRYALDSIFSFTDLPIRALLFLGALGTACAVVGAVTVFVGWATRPYPGARLHAADAGRSRSSAA